MRSDATFNHTPFTVILELYSFPYYGKIIDAILKSSRFYFHTNFGFLRTDNCSSLDELKVSNLLRM